MTYCPYPDGVEIMERKDIGGLRPHTMKRSIRKVLTWGCLGLVLMLILGSGTIYIVARRSVIPDNINMSSMGDMAGMDMSSMDMSTPGADATPIARLVAPDSDAPIKTFL